MSSIEIGGHSIGTLRASIKAGKSSKGIGSSSIENGRVSKPSCYVSHCFTITSKRADRVLIFTLDSIVYYGYYICIMTIGQLAKTTGLNVETIRYYENLKLISKPKSKDSKYRIYTNEYIDRINYIRKAKELGFTLKEIKDTIRFDDCEDLYELTGRKLNETQNKLAFYGQLTKKLKSLLKTCPKSGTIENCSIIKSISEK